MQVEGHELAFIQTNDRFKATLKTSKGSTVFMRAYLIKKGQFNSIVTLKNKVTYGSVIISMDRLKSTRMVISLTDQCRRLPICYTGRVQSRRRHN